MFEHFKQRFSDAGDSTIFYRVCGSGPPLLLLHGYPQTHVMWHKIAPELAKHFTVVVSDLRGYGDSGKPPTTPDHTPYSKRVTALDQLNLMQNLGFDRFYLAGHDRGGRVGHRLALDHPDSVEKLAVLDIAPTYHMYTSADMEFASAYYHWFFLIQPFDLPERLIGADPASFLNTKLGQWGKDRDAFSDEAMSEYHRCFTTQMIHASCEDYRASATIDLDHDQVDLDAGNKIQCPLLCLWGELGFVGRKYDILFEWSKWSNQVTGHSIACGHYLPEEAPKETCDALLRFFTEVD